MSDYLFVPLGADFTMLFEQLGIAEWSVLAELNADKIANRRIVLVGTEGATEAEARKLVKAGVGIARIEMAAPTEVSRDAVRAALRNRRDLFWRDYAPLITVPGDAEAFPTYRSGLGFLDKNLNWGWRLPELGIVAGPYGSGKSLLMQQLAMAFVGTHGDRLGTGALLCHWEDDARWMRATLDGFARSWQRDNGVEPSWCRRIHYVCRPVDDDRLVGWFVELVEFHHARYGTKFFTLDPWNEMDHKKDVRQLETEYTREMMKEFRRLVYRLEIILLIATHVPARMIKGDGSIEPFRIAHSFGSSQFANKADRGLCIVRSRKWEKDLGHMVLHIDKVKVEQLMGKKGTIGARWSEDDCRFEYDAHVTDQVQDIWKD